MKIHVKIYYLYFSLDESDFILCECCKKNQAVDIHHIHAKKMGGHKTFTFNDEVYDINDIINLIALCRACHDDAHASILSKGMLMLEHRYRMAGKSF